MYDEYPEVETDFVAADVKIQQTNELSPYHQVQQMYGLPYTHCGVGHGRDSGSVCSSTTDQSCSDATFHVSNTKISKQQRKRKKKRRFQTFAKWLMRFLEHTDIQIFRAAQEVIRNYDDDKKRKSRGDSAAGYHESITEDLNVALRAVVGEVYWNEARRLLYRHTNDAATTRSSSRRGPIRRRGDDSAVIPRHRRQLSSKSEVSSSGGSSSSGSETGILPAYHHPRRIEFRGPPHSTSMIYSEPLEWSPLTITSNWDSHTENDIRRERLFMILRVVMKDLETRDEAMYRHARLVIDECIAQNKAQDLGCTHLCESVKGSIKSIVGERQWRKAESYLFKVINEHNRPQWQQQQRDVSLNTDWELGESMKTAGDWTPIPLSEEDHVS